MLGGDSNYNRNYLYATRKSIVHLHFTGWVQSGILVSERKQQNQRRCYRSQQSNQRYWIAFPMSYTKYIRTLQRREKTMVKKHNVDLLNTGSMSSPGHLLTVWLCTVESKQVLYFMKQSLQPWHTSGVHWNKEIFQYNHYDRININYCRTAWN